MSKNKVKDILAWNASRSVHEVQQFLVFANFYRRFIRSYSAICAPLTQLTKKGQIWNWTTECQEAFELLKKCFVEGPILVNYHTDKPLMIVTNASDLAKGAVLSQYEAGDKRWHPVAFYSKKFSPAEFNYDVHDKEMVVIVDCMREWRHMLVGCPRRVVVYTDHRNLEDFQYTKVLSRRQARWAELLSEFNFVITYRSGEKNGKADVLSRRTDPALEGGDEPQILMFKLGQLAPFGPTNPRVMRITALEDSDELLSRYVMSVRAKEREPIELNKKILEAGLKDDQ